MSPQEVVNLTIENNNKIRLGILDYKISLTELDAAPSEFDWRANMVLSHEDATNVPTYNYQNPSDPNNPAASTHDSYNESTTALAAGVVKKFDTGTEAEVSVQSFKIKNEATVTSADLTTRVQAGGTLILTQPLLKGIKPEYNRNILRVSKAKSVRYRHKLMATINSEVSKSLRMFLDLQQINEEIKIKQDELKVAKELYGMDKALRRAGRKTKIDVLQSEAQVELAKAKVELAKMNYVDKETRLFNQILKAEQSGSDYKGIKLGPQDQTDIPFPTEEAGIIHHPEIRELDADLEESRLALEKADHELWPELELKAKYESIGMNKKSTEAYEQVGKGEFPNWEISLNFTFPLGNHAAKGSRNLQRAKRDGKETKRIKKIVDLQAKLEKSDRQIEKNELVLVSLKKRVKKEKEKLTAKKRLYKGGRIGWIEVKDSLESYHDMLLEKSKAIQSLYKERIVLRESRGLIGRPEGLAMIDQIK